MKLKNICHVNTDLLPYKLHFFFIYGSFGSIIPYLPIIAKELGINATAVGVGYTMLPIFYFFFDPFIGFLVDYFQNIKVFLVSLLVLASASYFSILSIPAINYETGDVAYVRVSPFNDSKPLLNISVPFERNCLEEQLQKEMHCKLEFQHEFLVSNYSEITLGDLIIPINITYKINESTNANNETGDKFWITLYTEDIAFPDIKLKMPSIKCFPNITQCSVTDEASSIFSSYQFLAFFAIVIGGGISAMVASTLSSVGCCEILGTQVQDYGRQRLFGTISWGLACSLAGILNDMIKSTEKIFPGFYLLAIFITIDIVIVCVINIPKAHISSRMCKDFGKIFISKEILIFSFGVAFIGFLSSIIAVYEFWFLEDMGANRTLLGLAVAVQCLVGEVPFLFFSGWFVNKLGYFLCFAGVFSGFALRLILYSVLKNPWFVLPVDVLHGLTFGLFHGSMTSFAKVKAPKGMEATLLGVFGGLYNGLGHGLGSFVGGIGLDNLGSRKLFLTTSMLGVGNVLIFLITSYVFKAPSARKTSETVPPEIEESFSLE